MSKAELVALNKFTLLINVEGDVAVLLYLGRKILLKGPFISNDLNHLLNGLKHFKPKDDHLVFLEKNGLAPPLNRLLITELFRQKLMDRIDPEQLPLHDEEMNSDTFSLLSSLQGTESASKCFKELSDQTICVLDFTNRKDHVLASFKDLPIKKLNYHRHVDFDPAHGADVKNYDLIVTISHLHHELEFKKYSSFLYSHATKWLQVTLDDAGGVVGPLFFKQKAPCYNCLNSRQLANLDSQSAEILINDFYNRNTESVFINDTFLKLLLGYTRIEIIKLLSNASFAHSLEGLMEFDFINIKSNFHALLPVPNCEICMPAGKYPVTNYDFKNYSGPYVKL